MITAGKKSAMSFYAVRNGRNPGIYYSWLEKFKILQVSNFDLIV